MTLSVPNSYISGPSPGIRPNVGLGNSEFSNVDMPRDNQLAFRVSAFLCLRTPQLVATLAPTLRLRVLIGQRIYRFEQIWQATKKLTFEIFTKWNARWDIRRSRRMKHEKLKDACLRHLLGDCWKFVRKNEVGSRVSFRNQTETEAIMSFWERGRGTNIRVDVLQAPPLGSQKL